MAACRYHPPPGSTSPATAAKPEPVTTVARQRWPRRIARWLGRALLLLIALYLVGRAVVELVTLDPTKPETYQTTGPTTTSA